MKRERWADLCGLTVCFDTGQSRAGDVTGAESVTTGQAARPALLFVRESCQQARPETSSGRQAGRKAANSFMCNGNIKVTRRPLTDSAITN